MRLSTEFSMPRFSFLIPHILYSILRFVENISLALNWVGLGWVGFTTGMLYSIGSSDCLLDDTMLSANL